MPICTSLTCHLRDQIKGRVQLCDAERRTLVEIGKKLSKQVLEEVTSIVKPDTILAWHRKLVAQKFDGSKHRQSPEALSRVILFGHPFYATS